MHYLLYSNTGLSSKQIGLTAQFVQDVVNKKNTIKIVQCDNVLENCFFNPLHNQLACAVCQSRSNQLYKQIGLSQDSFIKLKSIQLKYEAPFFSSLDELMSYKYDGINVGRGVASSILSYYKDHIVNSEKYEDVIALELRKAIGVYLNFKEIISVEKPDKVVFFNGRFAEVMPLFDFCRTNNFDFSVLEAGAKSNYELYPNCFPHSIDFRTKSTLELWDKEKDLKKKEEIGHNWFKKKRFGDESFEKSYTKNQEKGLLPKCFNTNKRNILILNSSEDEMKVIGEWKTDLYDNQNEAIEKILTHFENDKSIHFILRAHPNLNIEGNIQMEEIYEMEYDNFTVIKPHEVIDTYALMDACEKVITFGSTSGIESTYWGKPSILIGKSFYYLLPNTAYKPKTYADIYELISETNLQPLSKEACLPYGYYYSIVGVKSKDFLFNGLNNSTFKGKRIKKWYPSTFVYLVRYILKSKKWVTAFKAVTQCKFKIKDLLRFKI